jgi:hypothetical protein
MNRPARKRLGERFFDPEEVATVIDLFAPMRLALEHARAAGKRSVVWPWRDWRVPMLVLAGLLTVGGTGAALQARAVVEPTAAPVPAARLIAELPPPAPAIAPVALAPVTIAPAPRAQPRPPSDAETVAALNRRALSEYERSRSEAAVRLLSQAVRLCQRPALAWNTLCASSHVNLGRVLAGGYHQSGLAARHFRIAEAIRPGSAIRPADDRALRGGLTNRERSRRGTR